MNPQPPLAPPERAAYHLFCPRCARRSVLQVPVGALVKSELPSCCGRRVCCLPASLVPGAGSAPRSTPPAY